MNKLKSLFFQDVPESGDTVVTASSANTASMPPAGDILPDYEAQFDRLNLEGNDFYEFMRTLNKLPEADPSAYKVVALTLGLDKVGLLEKAKYYSGKIKDFYTENVEAIRGQIQESQAASQDETKDIIATISSLETQLAQLAAQLNQAKQEHEKIASKHDQRISDLNVLINSHEGSKDIMLQKINLITETIKNHL